MKLIEIQLPKLGESIVNATVVQWLKKVGDRIQLDEPLLEVSTDKVNSEIPSPVAGILKQILVQTDELVDVGAVLAIIETGMEANASITLEIKPLPSCPLANQAASAEHSDYYSPAVLRLAKERNISLSQLSEIPRTGEAGRLSKKDLETYLNKKIIPSPSYSAEATGSVELLKMSTLRKAIAENMVRSFYEAPHASLVSEIDVTNIMKYIQKEKEAFANEHGAKLTITSFLVHALAKAIEQFPMLNSSLDNDTIVMKRFVNVGIAVNVEKGLFVPVIKNCQAKDIPLIAKDIALLSQKARNQKLTIDEVSEGSITLTNFGMTGTLIGVPIIRHPEVAIIGAGAIQKRVVVRDDDSFAVRSMMYITLTFDHRVIDGIYGCDFLAALKSQLETQLTT